MPRVAAIFWFPTLLAMYWAAVAVPHLDWQTPPALRGQAARVWRLLSPRPPPPVRDTCRLDCRHVGRAHGASVPDGVGGDSGRCRIVPLRARRTLRNSTRRRRGRPPPWPGASGGSRLAFHRTVSIAQKGPFAAAPWKRAFCLRAGRGTAPKSMTMAPICPLPIHLPASAHPRPLPAPHPPSSPPPRAPPAQWV